MPSPLILNILVFRHELVQDKVGEDVVLAVKVKIALRAPGPLIQTPADAFVAKTVTAFCHVSLL